MRTPSFEGICAWHSAAVAESSFNPLRAPSPGIGMKVDKKKMNSLVFFALGITVQGRQLGPDIVPPRLLVRILAPLPIETLFERAFGLPLSQYSKMATTSGHVVKAKMCRPRQKSSISETNVRLLNGGG